MSFTIAKKTLKKNFTKDKILNIQKMQRNLHTYKWRILQKKKSWIYKRMIKNEGNKNAKENNIIY